RRDERKRAMPSDVVMPQMGESIAEGTVTRWMKKVGDRVERDEPLFEISTDKVDAEIPAPSAGTLVEILAQEGQTVAVNSVVARIGAEGEAPSSAPAAEAPAAKSAEPKEAEPAPAAKPESKPESKPEPKAATPAPKSEQPSPKKPAQEAAPAAAPQPKEEPAADSVEERRRTRSSPLVRKIAEENQVDITQIEGTGISGRVTKKDILGFIEQPRPATSVRGGAPAGQQDRPVFAEGESIRVEPMSVMRRRIADHMVMSRRTSAHVSTVFEVDFTNVDKLRRKHKASYAGEKGVNLTFLPFIANAVVAGLREWPVLNASIDGENVVYKQDINLGIAVALDWGLIVPVVKRADEKNVLGLARAINDLGERARTKKLNPEEVQGGTFTITNPGIFGGLFGLPIINQPQVAILGVGGVKKRAMVIETDVGDSIVIRSMAYLSLTFDHRLVDGAVADQFMAKVRKTIEDAKYAL
ncbi:MAG TPA: dihydrolipoamide acetyltransferase family protein, partial [Thermoanaerobaculia bacterium]|nr:dihydrolipoamide acetyltransferase family protein [Thermoanaerobaculia bacterium]